MKILGLHFQTGQIRVEGSSFGTSEVRESASDSHNKLKRWQAGWRVMTREV